MDCSRAARCQSRAGPLYILKGTEMDKNSPAMTWNEIIDGAGDLCNRMEDDGKYSSGEAVMILSAAQMVMAQRQMMSFIKKQENRHGQETV